uniref:RING-type domain-containing protein n=1 Tax=Plectus sambesii TaxID=2011161 RepID=A0A914WX26_9BILA
MAIKFFQFSFFSLLLFCSNAFIASLAVDPGDYLFVNLKKANLKVKDLRALLDKRGLPYHDFHEKSEYVNALIESGPLTVGELKIARNSTNASNASDDIEELVTDYLSTTFSETAFSNSEIWLVRIEPKSESMTSVLEEEVWHQLKTTLRPFEVQFGRFNCKNAAEYCKTKGWNSPTLILIVPRLHESVHHGAKAVVYLLQTSKNSHDQWVYEVDSVVRQVHSVLHEKLVRYLPSREDFDSLQTGAFKCSVHIVLLTDLRHYPFLLSALAAKFNYGSHCFAFGPKTIASGAVVLPDNHVGAFYAVKSQYYYTDRWQIVPQNQSAAGTIDGMSSAMVTFESLSELLNRLSPVEAKKPKPPKREPPKEVNEPSSPPTYTYNTEQPEYGIDFTLCWIFIGVLLPIFIAFLTYLYTNRSETIERRRTEELSRYRLNISSRVRSDQTNFWNDDWEEIEEEVQDELSFNSNSASLYSYDMSSNQEISLRSVEDFLVILSLRFTSLTDWHKKIFNRYSLHRAVSNNLRRLLAHYDIRVEEIGFPPYNWIMRLPTVENGDLSEDVRQSECLICQCSIDNPEDRLCRLPCKCKDIVYHYDCIAPWLIKREDPNSHSFSSGKLHTERPCPTCRYDITSWGLQQHLNND